jgi:hypothetical protein
MTHPTILWLHQQQKAKQKPRKETTNVCKIVNKRKQPKSKIDSNKDDESAERAPHVL